MNAKTTLRGLMLAAALSASLSAMAATAEEAARLKTDLTPLGAEKVGSKDGTIPAWTGGMTKAIPGDKAGGRRGDPFKDEKPLFSITAKNADQHADKLTDGTKAMLKKYPESFRVDVYKTHRTAAAPQWVYDNTARNAVNGKLVNGVPKGVYGGIPFPVPTTTRMAPPRSLTRATATSGSCASEALLRPCAQARPCWPTRTWTPTSCRPGST